MVKVNSLIDDIDPGENQVRNSPKTHLEDLKKPHLSEWTTRIEKLEKIHLKLAVETDPSIIFKLEKDIEEEESKITILENRLDEMP
jgi:predicted RNase H-like nuclease (RuvC/YqgF family)